MPVFAGVAGLIAVAAVAGGIRLLILGYLSGLMPTVLVPTVLVPLAMAAVIAALRASNLQLPQRHAGELLRDVDGILGPGAASAGPAAQSSSA
jgi:hypothetical protein